ncbi:transposon TX1 [Tanacetum coccineum]
MDFISKLSVDEHRESRIRMSMRKFYHKVIRGRCIGNLWMLFKKYSTVFDMFMVQKRLRNRQRYGFVRFYNIVSVEILLKRLRDIRVGSELLRVYLAYNRMGNEGDRGYRVKTSEEGSRVNRFNHKMHHGDVTKQENGGSNKRIDIRDTMML